MKEYNQQLREQNREKYQEYARERYKKHRKEHLDRSSCWNTRNRRNILIKKYGEAAIVQFEADCESQNKLCAICKRDNQKLVIDHDHSTNYYRGAICEHCNRGLGYFRDNSAALMEASSYLLQSNPSTSRPAVLISPARHKFYKKPGAHGPG